MDSVMAAIDALRRETRHDLRELRASVSQLVELIQITATKGEVNEEKLTHIRESLQSLEERTALCSAHIEQLETRVGTIENKLWAVRGGWFTLVTVAAAISSIIALSARYV